MSKNNVVTDALKMSSNRRSLLKKLGTASAMLGAASAGGSAFAASTPAPSDVVQFALNLEYLEAEFYAIATTGQNLSQQGLDVSGAGMPGPTMTSYGKVNFGNNTFFTSNVAQDIALDEKNHVLDLRAALSANGVEPVAKPAINLDALAPKGAGLMNEQSFLVLSRIFEDIGLSAYAGGAVYLAGSPYLMTAARITGVEGEHVANVRLQIARFGIASPQLDPADVVPPPSGSNFFSTNTANGLCAYRTPGQVLYLAYGNVANVTSGGFFPAGVNGVINMSSGPATASNLS